MPTTTNSNIASLFETALRTKMRFSSPRGALSLEQLWDVPLRARDGFSLDSIAQDIHKQIQNRGQSFVDSPAEGDDPLDTGLTLVKHVITVKKDEEKQAQERAALKSEHDMLLRILAEKKEGRLSEMSEKQLESRVKDLKARMA